MLISFTYFIIMIYAVISFFSIFHSSLPYHCVQPNKAQNLQSNERRWRERNVHFEKQIRLLNNDFWAQIEFKGANMTCKEYVGGENVIILKFKGMGTSINLCNILRRNF